MNIDPNKLQEDGYTQNHYGWWEKWYNPSSIMTHRMTRGVWYAASPNGKVAIEAPSYWPERPTDSIAYILKEEAQHRLHMQIYYYQRTHTEED